VKSPNVLTIRPKSQSRLNSVTLTYLQIGKLQRNVKQQTYDGQAENVT